MTERMEVIQMNQEELMEKKELIEQFMHARGYRPMKFKEMAGILQVPKPQRNDLRLTLEALMADGKVIQDGNGRYKIAGDNLKAGIFCGTQKGFGFVMVEGEEDIFIPEEYTKNALHGDQVQVEVKDFNSGKKMTRSGAKKRREGMVTAILERGNDYVVGTFVRSKNFGFVIADNQKFSKDIYVSKSNCKNVVDGHKVVVQLTSYGDRDKNPEGKIIEVLGHVNDPGVDILSIVKGYGLPEEFPPEVMKQVEYIPDCVSKADMAGRVDLRDLPTVTIDGEDAKDLDDAITLSKEDGIYHLGVHIADVSHYVTEYSELDKEALHRGTSVYLVDRVIPMLPHALSNGICSLNEGVDRLALSCLMDIDEKGKVIGHRITETVVNVTRRMSYTKVNQIIEDGNLDVIKEYESLVPMFFLMKELADLLREKRMKRGSIDFDFPECKIELDEDGRPTDIHPYIRRSAEKLIEDFMLIANETVAEDYFWQEMPFLYRTHEAPDQEKIKKLGIFINNFGYTIRASGEEIHPKEVQKLIRKIEGTDEENLISRLTLRSMKQARYTVSEDGHFGLATRYYCHFTSPIRRYPDLQIHRIIKENLHGGMPEKRKKHYVHILPEVAEQTSRLERRADEAEREVDKMKKAQYMEQYIGSVFSGVISGVTATGIFVELPNTVEGMLRVTSLQDDFYEYDEEHYALIGENNRKSYKLGQKIDVMVSDVNPILRTVDFILPREEQNGERE